MLRSVVIARMRAGLDRVLLGGQAERVPAHRVQHVEAAHALVARDDVGRGVALGVADVQPVARRVREHVEHVVLRAATCRPSRACERSVALPVGLPLGFDFLERICCHAGSRGRWAIQAVVKGLRMLDAILPRANVGASVMRAPATFNDRAHAQAQRCGLGARAVRCSLGSRRLLLSFAVGGCGFHLEGSGALPPGLGKTYLDSTEPHSEFMRA